MTKEVVSTDGFIVNCDYIVEKTNVITQKIQELMRERAHWWHMYSLMAEEENKKREA